MFQIKVVDLNEIYILCHVQTFFLYDESFLGWGKKSVNF